jgi:hypothetical protein
MGEAARAVLGKACGQGKAETKEQGLGDFDLPICFSVPGLPAEVVCWRKQYV